MAKKLPKRDIFTALWRGAWLYCPECNQGKIFSRYLKVRKHCEHCNLYLGGHRADDAPPYFTIFIVGHIIVPAALIVERAYAPSIYVMTLGFSLLAVVLCLTLLPIIKGAFVALQWALRLHGFAPPNEKLHDYE